MFYLSNDEIKFVTILVYLEFSIGSNRWSNASLIWVLYLYNSVPIMRFLLLLTLGISLSLAVHDFVLESANNDFSGFKVILVNEVTHMVIDF